MYDIPIDLPWIFHWSINILGYSQYIRIIPNHGLHTLRFLAAPRPGNQRSPRLVEDMHMAQFLAMYGCTEVKKGMPAISVWRKLMGFGHIRKSFFFCQGFNHVNCWDFVGFHGIWWGYSWTKLVNNTVVSVWACQVFRQIQSERNLSLNDNLRARGLHGITNSWLAY